MGPSTMGVKKRSAQDLGPFLRKSGCAFRRRERLQRLCVAFVLFGLGLIVRGQTPIPLNSSLPPPDIGKAIAALHDGNFFPADITTIVRANAIGEIPELEKQFSRTEDRSKKEVIASALIRLHAKDDSEYWNFLTKDAAEAIAS